MWIILFALFFFVGCGGMDESPDKSNGKDEPNLETLDLSEVNGKSLSEVTIFLVKNLKTSDQNLDQVSKKLEKNWDIFCNKTCLITKKENLK
jgi:hypothetical protein